MPISFLVGTGLYVSSLLLAGVIMAMLGKSHDNYQQPAPEGVLCFRRPLADRAPFFLICLTFLGGIFIWGGVMQIGEKTTPAEEAELFFPLAVLFLIASAYCLRRAGPEELSLYLANRTYCRLSGWPFLPKTYTGSMNQLAGICLRDIGRSPNRYYLVSLRWMRGSDMSTVGHYGHREEAEAEAQRLQTATGLPYVKTL